MSYLTTDDTDYVSSGVTLTAQLIIRATSIIDGYCKRKISVETYNERIPLTELRRGHLSYYPVIEVTALKGRPRYGLTSSNFFGPPQFEEILDVSVMDVDKSIGSVWCGASLFGAPYTELEVTYTSGWDPIPENVKVACGLLISQLASNPNSNIKAKKDFDFSIEYFGSTLVTPEIADLLSGFVIHSFR